MPTEVATLCFHTRDAAERSEGKFTFNLPCNALRNHAVKVALASCEFPIVQQTIEPEWNRFYYMEGLRLSHRNNFLIVVVQESGSERIHRLALPPRLNDASIRTAKTGALVVETSNPHNLFGADLRPLAVFSKLILASKGGDVELDNIEYVDAKTFRVRGGGLDASGRGSIHCPCASSPLTIAALLSECANRSGLALSFAYDDASDRIVPRIGRLQQGAMLRILPGDLAQLCGFSTVMYRKGDVDELPAEEGKWYDYIEMPSGFYSPCHRPMCVGQPLPFGPVLEASLNRYYFPLLQANGRDNGGPGAHLIVFTDPNGAVHTCTIPPGRYSEAELATHLEEGMTAAVAATLGANMVQYTVRVDAHRWRFECARKNRNTWREAVFSLHFHHPLSVEPSRFGFSSLPLSGCSSYVSSLALRSLPAAKNLLRVNEEGPRKRFRMHAVSIPAVIGVATSVDARTQTVVYSTYVNKNPYATGFRDGDLVRISPCPATEFEDGSSAEGTPVAMASGVHTCRVEESGVGAPLQVRVRLPGPLFEALASPGTAVQILSDCEPWNVHFGKEKSLHPHMLGWPKGGVLWGRDGCNDGFPPYEAPYVHSLDHPDYVCLTFSEMGGANLEHTYDHVTRPIFCKLSLYPLFREERMLPRDTQLMHDNMGSFTLSFWNPDMTTPYQFHGAEFSFSLAFFSAVPGGGGGEH